MKITLIILAFFLALLANAKSKPMTFQLVGNGGNCAGCEWIKAEGDITKETITNFRNLNPAPYLTVVLSSNGGDLAAGIELGRLFREAGISTSIGRTVPDNNEKFEIKNDAECNSACAYAFLGGSKRYIDTNSRLGFHQFYDPSALNKETTLNVVERQYNNARDQYISGVIVNYLTEMGIDTRLYTLASKIGPLDPMRYIKADEAIELQIDNSTDALDVWQIIPFGDGLLAQATTSTTKRRLRVYCSNDGNYYLTYFIPVEQPSLAAQKYDEVYSLDQYRVNLKADEDPIYTRVVVVAPVKNKNEIVIALLLDGKQAQSIAQARSIAYDWSEQSNVSHAALGYYSQTFTIQRITGKPEAPLRSFRLCI